MSELDDFELMRLLMTTDSHVASSCVRRLNKQDFDIYHGGRCTLLPAEQVHGLCREGFLEIQVVNNDEYAVLTSKGIEALGANEKNGESAA